MVSLQGSYSLVFARVTRATDTDGRAGSIDSQDDGLGTSALGALKIVPGDVEVVVGVDLAQS